MLEGYLLNLIEQRRDSVWVMRLLFAMSLPYRWGIRLRHWLYDQGWAKVHEVSVPVISVGNVVAGGTGKTPFVQMLARMLAQQPGQLAILLRGYRSKLERAGGVHAVSLGKGPLFPPDVCGDEPYLHAQRLQDLQAQVWVGKNRVEGARQAIAHHAAYLILDDGMQYRALKRDLEIVLIDARDPFARGHYLPYGRLRDCPERLSRVDLIVLNHLEDEEHFDEVSRTLLPLTRAKIIGAQMRIKGAQQWLGKRVGLFCGIGSPQRFEQTLTEFGVEVVDTLFVPDHRSPSIKELQVFAQECQEQGAQMLLCTEKDWVKLPQDLSLSLPIVCVEAEMQIIAGNALLQSLLEQLGSRTSCTKK